jgi:hypothetical protein
MGLKTVKQLPLEEKYQLKIHPIPKTEYLKY